MYKHKNILLDDPDLKIKCFCFFYFARTKQLYSIQQKKGEVKGVRKLTLTWPEFSSVVVSVSFYRPDRSPCVDINTLKHKMPSPSCKVTVGAGAVASKVFTKRWANII